MFHRLNSFGDCPKCLAQTLREGFGRLGQHHLPRLAMEQLASKLLLQCAHLMADGSMGDMQLFGRLLEALVPCGGFKGKELFQRGYPVDHAPIYKFF